MKDSLILVVDDSRIARSELVRLLRDMGIENTREAESGEQALELLAEITPDLFLLDLTMPGMDGIELCIRIKQDPRFHEAPVLFVTATGNTELLNRAFDAGAVDYIPKPFHPREMSARIRTHLHLLKHARDLSTYAAEMEALAARRAEQLVHNERLTTLGVLTADIVHEINNPLTYIAGHAQVLQKCSPILSDALQEAIANGLEESPALTAALEHLQEASGGIWEGVGITRSIIDNIRSFARRTTVVDQVQAIRLSDAVERALLISGSRLKGCVTIEQSLPDDLPSILGDVNRLAQVFVNLFVNAADAMRETPKKTLSITASVRGGNVMCTVSDTGEGMDEAALGKLFEPFFTTKDPLSGTGLGLSICRQIISDLGGKIHVTSIPGKGTTFSLLFQAADTDSIAPDRESLQTRAAG